MKQIQDRKTPPTYISSLDLFSWCDSAVRLVSLSDDPPKKAVWASELRTRALDFICVENRSSERPPRAMPRAGWKSWKSRMAKGFVECCRRREEQDKCSSKVAEAGDC